MVLKEFRTFFIMKNWPRILQLLRKTGDRFLIEDEQGNIFVLLNANDYENIVVKESQLKDLSEEELLNKINKDIAVWKAQQEDEKLLSNWQDLQPQKTNKIEEDQYYFEPAEDED